MTGFAPLSLLLVAWSLAGCASAAQADCGAPASTRYSCALSDAGSCAAMGTDGSAGRYPAGCVATRPSCSAFTGGTVPEMCTCEATDGGGAWSCP